ECKVESGERKNQLSDYTAYIQSLMYKYKKGCILYITKYFEKKDSIDKNIPLIQLRWYEVSRLIVESNNETTKEFRKLLIEYGMDEPKNFTLQDMMAMKTISSTISKMDEILEIFKPEFETNFGGFSKTSSRSSQLNNNQYSNYVYLKFKNISYWISVGFFWWWEDHQFPYIGFCIEIPAKDIKGNELQKIFESELIMENSMWEFEEDGNSYFYFLISLVEFVDIDDTDHITSIKSRLMEGLNEIYEVKKKYPEAFER
uniref:hypothetical protein n=1 Tax=Aquiflexum sp. TaxID=1872584 RepID=UPI0035937F67